jgi:hypothetical protein
LVRILFDSLLKSWQSIVKTLPDDLLDERVVGVHKAEGGDVGASVPEVL